MEANAAEANAAEANAAEANAAAIVDRAKPKGTAPGIHLGVLRPRWAYALT